MTRNFGPLTSSRRPMATYRRRSVIREYAPLFLTALGNPPRKRKRSEDRGMSELSDLEIVRACALAMGWKHLGAIGIPPPADKNDASGLWCLSGANDWWETPYGRKVCGPCNGYPPDPLRDDAQCLQLGKRFPEQFEDAAAEFSSMRRCGEPGADFNAILCRLVARMQLAAQKE